MQPLKEIAIVTHVKETNKHKLEEEKEIVTVTLATILKPHDIKQEALKPTSNEQTKYKNDFVHLR